MAKATAIDEIEQEHQGFGAPRHVEMLESASHEVNGALGTIVLCIDFLAHQTGTSQDPALLDARSAVLVVAARMKRLREVAIGLRAEAAVSGVFPV